jgi:nitrite reductase/ring-hydroxylating ferredoxin subunit
MALQHVAELDELEEAKPRIVSVAGRDIGLIRANGTVYAVRNICPHKAAPLCRGLVRGTMLPSEPATFVFGMENQILQCPWHGWEFDLETGRPVHGGQSKLTLYPVIVRGQSVYLELV